MPSAERSPRKRQRITAECERYANNILWISALDMILMSWDVTEKKTYRDGGILYRSKYPAARAWQRFVVNTGCGSGNCMSGRSACVSREQHHLSLSRWQLHRHRRQHLCDQWGSSFVIAAVGA
jgi:hypothetical protein